MLTLVAYFFGGFFLANAIPHLVSGMMGEAFQTPFARPRGAGKSSSTLNVLWSFFNLLIGYLLVCRVGDFDLKNTADVASLALGAMLIALYLAWHFGRFNGGSQP